MTQIEHLQAAWTPSQDDFNAFAAVSGDDNAIHTDPEFSARTRFGRTVSHGMLIYAKLWALLHTAYPEAQPTHQNLMFPNPCFAGETVSLEVRALGQGRFSMTARRVVDGAEVLTGQAEVAL